MDAHKTPDAVREALEPLRKLFDAAEGQWPKTPWKLIPSDGKPIIASERGGNLFRGYIATWQEAELVVGIVNALPAILAALDSRARDAVQGWTPLEAWRELSEYTDRTSPAEYPDMCLITFNELRMFMATPQPGCICGEVEGENDECPLHGDIDRRQS